MSTSPITPAPGPMTWNTLPPAQTLWSCGCLEQGTATPKTLIRWCGQPDCLRLAAAGVAYTQQQFNWQVAHGGTPGLVAATMRAMVTPLAQVLPPPPAGVSYMSGDIIDSGIGGIIAVKTEAEMKQEEEQEPGKHQPGKEHDQGKGKPPEPHRPGQPSDKPPQQRPGEQHQQQKR